MSLHQRAISESNDIIHLWIILSQKPNVNVQKLFIESECRDSHDFQGQIERTNADSTRRTVIFWLWLNKSETAQVRAPLKVQENEVSFIKVSSILQRQKIL